MELKKLRSVAGDWIDQTFESKTLGVNGGCAASRLHQCSPDVHTHYTGLRGSLRQRDLRQESRMRVVKRVCPLVRKVMLPQGAGGYLERQVMHTAPLQPEPSSSGQRVRAHCFACVVVYHCRTFQKAVRRGGGGALLVKFPDTLICRWALAA